MNSHQQQSRTFIRHPVDMPIDVEPLNGDIFARACAT